MSTRTIFPPKAVAENVLVPFDFVSLLGAGETIASQVVSATVWSGTDANPGAIVNGAATVAGTVVRQAIVNGLAGVIYLLVCTIVTSISQTFTMSGYMVVLATATP